MGGLSAQKVIPSVRGQLWFGSWGSAPTVWWKKTWSTKVGILQLENRVSVTLSYWALLLWSAQTPTPCGAGRWGTSNTLNVTAPEGTLPCYLQNNIKYRFHFFIRQPMENFFIFWGGLFCCFYKSLFLVLLWSLCSSSAHFWWEHTVAQ